ncbi:hypothetical protein [Ktedonospora formicarum]|uniref:Uncharacterized protein n=1 Tax=Ktedonospora formicarum TaxID=2778364 RepID=A0A8J3MNI6_9CHLR|nr:hypothetical protein [Ktedonospora formicarum]GHO42792.1 hypothetical protein KSX_09550 [Ktedonospora formicarum]
MFKVGRWKQQKKRRWWHYLDLIIIVIVLNLLVFATRPLPLLRTALSSITTITHQSSLAASYTGLNTIVIPLTKIIAQADCSDPNLSETDLQKCMEGNNSGGTYTNDKAKIQNPISKGSSLFFFTPLDITVSNSNVLTMWGFVMGIVDAFLVILLMLNGIRIILTGSVFTYSRVIEELPGVLLAIIVAHSSLLFITLIIGTNNSMTTYIYNFAQETPGIHRSHSGFASGKDTKELTLRVFFPYIIANKDKETYYEKLIPIPNPYDAKDQWPGPKAGYGYTGNKGTTDLDITKFNKDMVCTSEKVNFDVSDREYLFGTSANIHDGYLYQSIKGRSENIIRNKDDRKMPQDVLKKLQDMPHKIEEDLSNLSKNDVKWYQDLEDFSTEMTGYENKYLISADSAGSYKDDTDKAISAASQLFNGAGGGNSTNGNDLAGDVIVYKCQPDATGDSFQLVPDDINFTDLFKDLQTLSSGLGAVAKVMAVMLLGQMIIRLFFINLYTVLAPLGIACGALPGKVGQPVVQMWLKGFISIVLVQFVMAIALIVTQILLGEILSFTAGGDPNHIAGNLDNKTLSDLIRIACLYFVFRIPSLLQSAPLRTMTDAGQAMGQAVGMTIAMQIMQIQLVSQVGLSAGSIGTASLGR